MTTAAGATSLVSANVKEAFQQEQPNKNTMSQLDFQEPCYSRVSTDLKALHKENSQPASCCVEESL